MTLAVPRRADCAVLWPLACRLVAVLERRAFVYDLESLQLLGTLDTPANPRGLAALTTCSEPCCLLALPALGGTVRVYDAAKSSSVDVLCELEAHKSLVVSGGGLSQCLAAQGGQACAWHTLNGTLRYRLQSVMAWDDDGDAICRTCASDRTDLLLVAQFFGDLRI